MTSFLIDLVPAGGVVRSIGALLAKPFIAAWRWTTSDIHRPVIVALFAVLAVHWIVLAPATRRNRDAALKQLGETRTALVHEQSAHAQTIRNHAQAAGQAEAAQAANLKRVAAEQAAQSERIARSYEDDLAVLRARRDHLAEQLRQAAAPGAGLSDAVYVPGASEGAGSASQAAKDQGLPPALCTPMNLDERFVASAQALQLNALIDWVEAQSALEMNP